MRRGDIYYIKVPLDVMGSEQGGNRPGIVVSNDIGNRHASVVEVVYLTGVHKKKHLPTHVRIRSSPHSSTALCEQVYTVHKERLGRYMGHINHAEQTEIDWALHISLGLE